MSLRTSYDRTSASSLRFAVFEVHHISPEFVIGSRTMVDKLISVLNDLVETSKDGEQGFHAAAEDTKTAELREVFMERAEDCACGATDLQELIAHLGGHSQERGSIAGAVHRGWVHLTATVSRSDLSILEECERGEDVAAARYREALAEKLPDHVRAIVRRQCYGVERNHHQIRDLRDRYRDDAA